MIVAKDKLALTEYIKAKKLIISTYKGRVDKDMSFVHLVKVKEFYTNNQVNVAIIDLRELYGSFINVMDYLAQSFYPVAVKSGLKAQAFVITDDLIIENMASKLVELTSKFDIKARTFSTKRKAEEWIDTII